MAGRYSPFPSSLHTFDRPRRRTLGKDDQPLPLFHSGTGYTGPTDRVSSVRYPASLEDPSLDPFYLERSLEDVTVWESYEKGDRYVAFDKHQNDNFMSSSVKSEKEPSLVHPHNDRERLPSTRYQHQTPKLECDSGFGYAHYPSPNATRFPFHYSQNSCSSMQSDATGNTPDLTPSSSFSSTYSVPTCPDAVLNATKQLSLHTNRVQYDPSDPGARLYLPCGTSTSRHIDPYTSTEPSTPTETINPYDFPYNASSETLIMHFSDPPAPSASSLRSKPLPTLPNISRHPSRPPPPKKCHSPGFKTQIDPSIISPPSLIDPVTLEPHASPYDQAFFIPANDCPSPVPSPIATSPPITCQITGHSTKGRPSTSTSEAHCEQSVWESDSDSESIGPKSLSRRGPIETLRKVRSRVQLKATKSTTKFDGDDDERTSESLPPMPNNTFYQRYPDVKPPINANWTAEPVRASVEHTLRLVAPSTTSLPRPQSRHDHQDGAYGIGTSTAAAIHAQSRRRQRSSGQEECHSFHNREVVYGRCLDSHSAIDLNAALSLSRPGLFKRLCRSLRALSCSSTHDEEPYEKTIQ